MWAIMSRALSVIAKLMVVWCLVFVQAPQPCRGDAHGGACSVTACACVASCTCQVEHREARALEAKLATLPTCCKVDGALAAASEALLAACHGPEAPKHFAPPAGHDPALAPPAAPAWLPPEARGPTVVRAATPTARPLPPAARPPWTTA